LNELDIISVTVVNKVFYSGR